METGWKSLADFGDRAPPRWVWSGEKLALHKLGVHPVSVARFFPPCEGVVRGGEHGITSSFGRRFEGGGQSITSTLRRGGNSAGSSRPVTAYQALVAPGPPRAPPSQGGEKRSLAGAVVDRATQNHAPRNRPWSSGHTNYLPPHTGLSRRWAGSLGRYHSILCRCRGPRWMDQAVGLIGCSEPNRPSL
jgi:hypothetical protein